ICLTGFEKGSLQFLPICFCAILFTPIIVAFQTLMRRRTSPITKGPFTFTFNAEGIRTKGAAFEQLIQWAGIVRVRQSKRFLFLFVSRSKALFIPVKALEDQSVLETVQEIVREHAPANKV
ncbi:MAG TPA: YcxB family protein, partial [Verrucomicrobiae bacterium]|nr:YcxB family protein [Verrucomicrobiae bacterium]